MINNREDFTALRQQAEKELNSYDCRILVCSGTGCIATGSNKIFDILKGMVSDCPNVSLVFSPCGGHDDEKIVGVKKTG